MLFYFKIMKAFFIILFLNIINFKKFLNNINHLIFFYFLIYQMFLHLMINLMFFINYHLINNKDFNYYFIIITIQSFNKSKEKDLILFN